MGLLDDVLAAATRGGQQPGQGGGGGLGDLLGGLLGSHQGEPGGGLGGMLGGMLGGAGQQQAGGGGLADVLGSLLGNDGRFGGLGGLLARFHQAGLGDKANSWVGSGANADVSSAQVSDALGEDTVSDVASKLNIDHGTAGSLLATLLPLLIDRLTPHGQAPSSGLGDRNDVLSQIGAMLRNR